MPAGHAISDPTPLHAFDPISNAYIGLLFVPKPSEHAIVSQRKLMPSLPAKCFHQQCMHCATVVCAFDKHVMVHQHKCMPIHKHNTHWLVSDASWHSCTVSDINNVSVNHHIQCSTVVSMPADSAMLPQTGAADTNNILTLCMGDLPEVQQ